MDMNFTGERFVPQLRGQIYYEHFHRYAAGLSMVRGKDVLDIASGEGYGAAFLAMAAKSVVGVDIDEASVRHAAARYPAMNLSFRAGNATQIPLADASVDVITSFETIEHLVPHEQMLQEMLRVLRVDGRLLISSPNRLVYSDARGYSNPFHVRELYFHEFRDLLRGFFAEVRIYGQRIFGACAIHPIGGSMAETRWLGPSLSMDPGIPGLSDPEYFVAVCGRVAGEELPNLSTIYLDQRDDLLSDVRSGGLTSVDTSAPVAGLNESGKARLALASWARVDANGDEARQEQIHELERVSAECERLKHQNQELELLRSGEYDRADRAEQELRAVRRREAEGRLKIENVEIELHDMSLRLVTSVQEAVSARDEVERLKHEMRIREGSLELLLARLSVLQMALEASVFREESLENLLARSSELELALEEAQRRADSAQSQLDEILGSRSWRVTAPLRKAVSRIR